MLTENIKKNDMIRDIYVKARELYYKCLFSDEGQIRKQFKSKMGRDVELNNPVRFNDKLQWLKLYWYDPVATKCADKYEVRKFVSERIGSKYLNELYGVYESLAEIDINKLPHKFVLKGTHGSGFNIVCKDKSEMNWHKEFKKMKRWLRTNYFWSTREWVYKNIRPRIICERYLQQDDGDELRDYRFFCFNGEPKFITVDFSITDKTKTRRNLYALDWLLMNEEISYPKELVIKVKKPEQLHEMIELSKELSGGFPHARIDFYYISKKIIFGEITFFHQSGMGKIKPLRFEEVMGNWLELPDIAGDNI